MALLWNHVPAAPRLSDASPVGDIACPIGTDISPRLTTPATPSATQSWSNFNPVVESLSSAAIAGLHMIDRWAWELSSDAGSVPSVWSKASTAKSSVTSSLVSTAEGDGLIPGLVEGQRLSYIAPCTMSSNGGRAVVSLRREVQHGYWNRISIILVQGPTQMKLEPVGVRKGKKFAIEIPPGMKTGDYDVRLSFGGKMLHGAVQVTVCKNGDIDGDD